jgi:hypothetical protein
MRRTVPAKAANRLFTSPTFPRLLLAGQLGRWNQDEEFIHTAYYSIYRLLLSVGQMEQYPR